MDEKQFELYYKLIQIKIKKILQANKSQHIIRDILLDKYLKKHSKEIANALLIKQIQMKIGNIWQIAIGNYENFIDLKNGHVTGLDIKNKHRKIIMELKNRYNTDNSSSRKTNYDKLAKYKKTHPDYSCVYAVINDKNINGCYKKILHNDVFIEYYSGTFLFEYIFGEDHKKIILFLCKIIKYSISQYCL
jgi:hypothetical protein